MQRVSVEEKIIRNATLKATNAAQDRRKRLQLGLPVTKVRRKIPWGYEADPKDAKNCIPVDFAFECLWKAKNYLKSSSYYEVAQWLVSCGFPISTWGLYLLFKERPPFPEVVKPLEERQKLL